MEGGIDRPVALVCDLDFSSMLGRLIYESGGDGTTGACDGGTSPILIEPYSSNRTHRTGGQSNLSIRVAVADVGKRSNLMTIAAADGHILTALDRGILTVTLNRPDKKNALSNAMYGALADALLRAESEAAIRVVVIESSGADFTSGNDLGDFAAVAAGKLRREDMNSGKFLSALARADKPIVAAVPGIAVGIGVTMLLHCDLSFVAIDAKLSTPFVNLGLVPEAASSMLLPARIGYARAYRMFALGEAMDGRSAAEIGLVTAALPGGEVRAAAAAAAGALAAKPIGALKAMKRLVRDAALIQATMSKEGEVFGARLKTPEAAEAFRAFAERRPPDFSQFS